ncbi:MAG: HAD hydrolase family protein [Chloroflexota bacterium]
MAESYLNISKEIAHEIRLVMTDVDGTITSGDSQFTPPVTRAICELEADGIRVGLVSGRDITNLDDFAARLNVSGPLIGENGAVARMRRGGEMVELGFSQAPALRALERLQKLFPGAIEAGEWNKKRTKDLIIRVHGITTEELKRHLDDIELLDSGYVLHLAQKGISKGGTLMRLACLSGEESLSPDKVLVLGDAPTDLTLFRLFPVSVLVVNPDLDAGGREMLERSARFVTSACCGDGFAEVVQHILSLRH